MVSWLFREIRLEDEMISSFLFMVYLYFVSLVLRTLRARYRLATGLKASSGLPNGRDYAIASSTLLSRTVQRVEDRACTSTSLSINSGQPVVYGHAAGGEPGLHLCVPPHC